MDITQTKPPIRKSEQIDHLVRFSRWRLITTGMGRIRIHQSVIILIIPKAIMTIYLVSLAI